MSIIALTESQDPIAALSRLRGPADIRAFLNLSLGQIAFNILDTTAHLNHPISRSTYWDWEVGRRKPTVEQVRQIERLIEKSLHAELAYDAMLDDSLLRKFVVRIKVGHSRWYVKAFTACSKCARMYHVTRIVSKRCKRCIVRSKRK